MLIWGISSVLVILRYKPTKFHCDIKPALLSGALAKLSSLDARVHHVRQLSGGPIHVGQMQPNPRYIKFVLFRLGYQ